MEKYKYKRLHNKYCSVPFCVSSSMTHPKKRFLLVPRNERLRNQWFAAANKIPIKASSRAYFCEDHFDLPSIKSWDKVSNLRANKNHRIPTKFDCQLSNREPVKVLRIGTRYIKVLEAQNPLSITSFFQPEVALDTCSPSNPYSYHEKKDEALDPLGDSAQYEVLHSPPYPHSYFKEEDEAQDPLGETAQNEGLHLHSPPNPYSYYKEEDIAQDPLGETPQNED